MKSFFKIFLILSLIILTFCGCENINKYQKDIYDDDSKIVNVGDSYSFSKRIENNINNNLKIKYNGFYGMETIWDIKSEGNGAVIIRFDSQVDRGKFKLVFITPDNEVIKVFEQSEKGEKIIETKKGKSRIKIVGNNAKGQVEINVETKGDALLRKSNQ
ncbi:hypothetical protein TKV_c16850 [Thermoanaerobacter kivui]|uniref:Lipoprotein n=1 Tax=Thermoanaerobacter kivui TaxID=2325 RepID=A0A097ASQ1_THEKI|nr:hypothetical protein [Thermoanaerobacter kivui]AIS52839.1 hypothetical protein TKV_c16850 [Thermoanaerobacter kivui]